MSQDIRKDIVEAGLAILQEQGLAGLTQPRIATRTGLRQSHLTYYYPTRADLLTAVMHAAIEAQLAAVRSMIKGASSAEQSAAKIAVVTVLHKNTRVLAALNQAADQEPTARRNGKARAEAVLKLAFRLLSGEDDEQDSRVRDRGRTTPSQRPANHRP